MDSEVQATGVRVNNSHVVIVRLQQRPIEYQGVAQKPSTVPIGGAAFDKTTDPVERLLARADEALCQAKREGRDRVVAARPVAGESKLRVDSVTSAC